MWRRGRVGERGRYAWGSQGAVRGVVGGDSEGQHQMASGITHRSLLATTPAPAQCDLRCLCLAETLILCESRVVIACRLVYLKST